MLAATAALVAGCITLAPPSGPSQLGRLNQQGTDQGQAYPQLIPVPPGGDWSPERIVSGFLAASASFANGHAVARQYLDPVTARRWNPTWAVTVVGQPQVSEIKSVPAKPVSGSMTATVRVTGQQLATLTGTGQPLPSSSAQVSEDFSLTNEDGQWRITELPAHLLLSRQTFLQVYQPRNLYFLSPSGALVPDPVFVPQQATDTALAYDLVRALRPPGPPEGALLFRAVHTSFPAGATLHTPVRVDGTLATVNLGGAAAATSQEVRQQMAAQLVWTLTSQSYAPSPIQSVVLEINGHPQAIRGAVGQLLRNYQAWVPAQAGHADLYFTGSDGVLRELTPGGKARPLPGAAGDSRHEFSAIAVSPTGSMLAATASSARGCVVETAGLSGKAAFTRHVLPGSPCTSLSWDSSGDLWAAAGRVVWMLPPGASPQRLGTGLLGGDSVSVFRVAPDGVRAVMITRSRSGSRLLLGSIARNGSAPVLAGKAAIGAGIANPVDVSWHGPDHAIVLSGPGLVPQLTDVPLNGEPGTPVPAPAGRIIAMTATASSITVAEQNGHLLTSASPGRPWQPVSRGSRPAYRG